MNPTKDTPWKYSHVTADKQVIGRKGVLHAITINGLTTAGDLTVYDNTEASGTDIVAILHLDPTTGLAVVPATLLFDCKLATGLYMSFDATLAADLTVSYY